MNVLGNVMLLFNGLTEFYGFFRTFWTCLPLPCQLLIAFSFSTVLLIGLIKMVT